MVVTIKCLILLCSLLNSHICMYCLLTGAICEKYDWEFYISEQILNRTKHGRVIFSEIFILYQNSIPNNHIPWNMIP